MKHVVSAYGTAAPSTDATTARYPAAAADSALARVSPRSRSMYIWANRTPSGAAAAISSSARVAAIEHYERNAATRGCTRGRAFGIWCRQMVHCGWRDEARRGTHTAE